MKYIFRNLTIFSIFILASVFSSHATDFVSVRYGVITGRIVNKDKIAVYPAVVRIEGFSIGDDADENGVFYISGVPEGEHIIIISGIGIKLKKVTVNVVAGKENQVGDLEVESSDHSLSEVTVLGKSEARRQQEQAYAVSVLDLKKDYSAAIPLNKLLNTVSSVRIREDGGMGSNYNFSLNGFSGNQVKFFLDGIPMDNFGSSFNLANFSANMADRVEVYKGVLPVNLGSDALGGAVNIISRKDANYIDATYSFGSFNTHRAAVNGAYTANNGFTVHANVFYNYSDNDYEVYVPIVDLNTNKKMEERWVRRFHDAYWSVGMRFETGVTGKSYADYLLAGIIYSKNDNDVQTGATMDAVYGGVKAKSSSIIPSVRYKKDDLFVDGLSLSIYGTYNVVDAYNTDTLKRRYNWLGESIPSTTAGERYYTDVKIKNREWQGNGNLNYIINSHQSLMLNYIITSMGRRSNDKVHQDDPMNNIPQRLTKNITGLGWQIRYERWNANIFGKMYRLYSSAYKRVDEYTENARWIQAQDRKTNFGYGAAVTYYILNSLQAKLSYEQAYRLPEAVEMFGDGLIQQRNPDLKPENSRNLNIGLEFNKIFNVHTIFAETNFIFRNTKDFILKAVSLTSNPTTGYDNLGKVLTRGVEGTLRYSFKELFYIGGSISYQDIIDNKKYEEIDNSYVGGITENVTYKQRLPNIPYLFANGNIGFLFRNIGWKNTALTIDYRLNYVHEYFLSFPGLGSKSSKNIIPEQFSHDISAGYSLAGGRYSVVVECTNLNDRKLYDNFRLQKPGRAFNVKLRYFFNK
ncbi:TonB-dependent receptor [Coprobacter tertius]|uniref:TonB-dependent receptor n=1 Tax=Coprobacter tertius TaxID=2944915 RepID=A0ABT1MJX8_9BACT|nr:TonB-dependent receptor [Coprobacter tertius]MCP9612922.1 TonB-dependent receptor [Coprobacter tertius]